MAVVGSAHVVIRALTDKLQADIKGGLRNAMPAFSQAGRTAGQNFKSGFNSGSGRIDPASNIARGSAARAMSREGSTAGRSFTNSMNQSVRRGGTSLQNSAGGIGAGMSRSMSSGFNRGGGPGRMFASVALRIAALVPILGAVVGAISTVVSGLFAIGSAAASAAQALVVLPSLLGAVVQAGAVMLGSFSGLGDALGAGMEAAKVSSVGASDDVRQAAQRASDGVADAARGVRQAEEAAAEGVRAALQGVADARRNLADTYRTTRQSMEAAIEAVTDAEEAHADALDGVRQAQEALNDARAEARERIIDLQFASEEGTLSERRAILALQDARYELNAASELPVDNRIRQEAQLAYEEADLNLRMIRERNGDIAKEQKNVKKNGIDGMDEVVSAQQNLADAQETVRDAVEGVSDALEDQRQTAADNQRAIAEAQRGVADALDGVTEARKAGNAGIRDARDALKDAKNAQGEANIAMAAGSVEASKYQEELANLSPTARRFVKFLVSLRDEFGALRDAGQRGMFPGLQTAIQTLVTGLFPTLERMMFRTGRAIAQAANSIANAMTSGPFVRNFRDVTDQNAVSIARMGRVTGNLMRALFAMLDAAGPLVDRFTNWLVVWSRGLRITTEANNRTGELTKTFNKAGDRMALIVNILGDLWEGFRDLGGIADNSGMRLLRVFERSTEAFANFTDKAKNRRMLREFFSDVANNFIKISGLIKVVGAAFFRLGADPNIGKLADALRGTVTRLENLITTMLDQSGTSMVKFVNSLLDAFAALASGPAMKVFLGVFVAFFNTITAIMNTPVLGDLAKGLLAVGAGMYAISLITKFPGLAALGRVGFINKGLVILKTNLGWIVKLMARFLLTTPLGLFFTALGVGVVFAYKKVAWFRNMIDGAFAKIKAAVGGAFSEIRDLVMGDLVPAFMGLFNALKRGGGGIMNVLRPVVEFLFNVVLNAVLGIINGIKNVFAGIINIVSGFFKLFTAIITGDWGKAWDAVKQILGGALQSIIGVIEVWFNFGILALFRQGFKALFRIWAGIWNAIKPMLKNAWNGGIKPVFMAIWRIIQNVLRPTFRGLGEVIGTVWKGIWGTIKLAWRIIKPILKAIWWVIKNVLWPIFKTLFKVVREVFKGIWGVIKFAWNNVIKPIWKAIKWYIDKVLRPVFNFLWQRVVKPVFKGIGEIIRGAWNNVIKPIWKAIKWYIDKVLKPVFVFLRDRVVKPVFETVGRTIKNAWQNVIKPIFVALKDFIRDSVIPAFKRGVDRIGTIWDSLKRKAAVPVNFVIETVYNNGLRTALNLIPGVNLGRASRIQFAEGGVMPGYTPGRDVHKFYSPTAGQLELSGGEAIMRPEFTKAVGGAGGVERLNKMARRGMKFARGGVVWPLAGGSPSTYSGHDGVDLNVGSGWDDYGLPIRAFRSGIITYVGSARGYGNAVFQDGSNYPEVVYGHMSRYSATPGQAVRAGETLGYVGNSGNSSAPHLHFGVPGGTYAGAMALLQGATGMAGSSGIAPVSARTAAKQKWSDVITELPGRIKDLYDTVKKMMSSDGMMGMMGDAMRSVIGRAIQWVNDKIPNRFLPDNPISNPFDKGGVASGAGWMPKATPLPERVLSPRQTEAFDRLVDILDRRTAGATVGAGDINLDVHVPHDASPREVVDGIVYELKRLERGGRYNR